MSCTSGSTTVSIATPPMGDDSWVGWFLSQIGNEFLCRVPLEFMRDKFNLYDLESEVVNFSKSLDTIMDPEFCANNWVGDGAHIESERLYGLIHARYIMTAPGIDAMRRKYEYGDFGICPRVYCEGQHVLPIGLSEKSYESTVKIFCPCCRDIYQPTRNSAVLDGCMFGPNFPHMFLMELPTHRPTLSEEKYVPRLYGFQLHKSALEPVPDPAANKCANSYA
ncbi:suppressor-of-stellate-like protein [Drosophila pseudoobscura]|uniref:Suppressor-of-stellate-like protein n=1 Tax=Drosophila pseudoobscura pseudoobscura TaxID=46245 RepID=A0A6I8V696_DROPS|nr:suppressor-of-stellate-like protein [Drosophila pseudoobscura]